MSGGVEIRKREGYVRWEEEQKCLRREERGGCMYGWGPHGVFPMSVFLHNDERDRDDEKTKTRMESLRDSVIMTSPWCYYTYPLFLMGPCLYGDVLPVSRENMRRCLRERREVHVFPGGVEEVLSRPFYRGHVGFARVAYEMGVPLVPVLIRGEEDYVHTHWDWITRWTFARVGIPFIFPYIEQKTKKEGGKKGGGIKLEYGNPLWPKDYESGEQLQRAYYAAMDEMYYEKG